MQRESISERVSNRDDESRRYTIEGEIVSSGGVLEQLSNGQVYSADGIHRAHFNAGASPLNVNFSGETIPDDEQLEIFTAILEFVAEARERRPVSDQSILIKSNQV